MQKLDLMLFLLDLSLKELGFLLKVSDPLQVEFILDDEVFNLLLGSRSG